MIRYEMTVPGWSDEVYYSWEGEGEYQFAARVLRGLHHGRYRGLWGPRFNVKIYLDRYVDGFRDKLLLTFYAPRTFSP